VWCNFETINNEVYEPLPVLFIDHVRMGINSYLLLNSDLFDGKGNMWRDALELEGADLEFERVADTLAILIVPNPDNYNIEFMGKHHFKRGDKIYYLNNQVEGVDVKSFEVYMSDDSLSWLQKFSRDVDHVYVRGELIEGADPDTFTGNESGGWYYQDKNYVYNHEGDRLEGEKDSFVFNFLGINTYAKSDTHVYFHGYAIEGADPETFAGKSRCYYDAYSYFLPDPESWSYMPDYMEVSEEEWLEECEATI